MKRLNAVAICLLFGFLLMEIPCWGANSATLQDMLGKHMDRVMRKKGLVLPTRHGEPSTNWFGRVVMEGEDALPFGYNYIQLRDSDGWAEVRDETGALTCEVEPIREDAAFVLGDLFGFVPSEDTPPELRLSHLVSKWLVCHSQEESDAIDITDDEWDVLQSERTRRRNLRNHRLAEAPLVVTNLMTTAIVPSENYVDLMVEWPSSMTLPYYRLDLYSSVDLKNWTFHSWHDVMLCPNLLEVQILKDTIPGFLEHLPAQHEATCYIVTNISASAFQPGVSYTNRHWNCDHQPRGETPGFFRWQAVEEPFSNSWVYENYPDEADMIIARGYEQWVDDQVGYGLENGYYKLNVTVTGWSWPNPKTIRVGDKQIRVFEPGTYSFLLEKGFEYEIETTFARNEISFSMQDDLADEPTFADYWWDGLFWVGLWNNDGGQNYLCSAYAGSPGFCFWMPILSGSPDLPDHLTDQTPRTFVASLADYRYANEVVYHWTCDDDNIVIATPNASATQVTFRSFPSWRRSNLIVEAEFNGSRLISALSFTYGSNLEPQTALEIDAPDVVFVWNSESPACAIFKVSFVSDSNEEGTIRLTCDDVSDRVVLWWNAERGSAVCLPQTWGVSGAFEQVFFIEGYSASSSLRDVVYRAEFIPLEGEPIEIVKRITVVEVGEVCLPAAPDDGLVVMAGTSVLMAYSCIPEAAGSLLSSEWEVRRLRADGAFDPWSLAVLGSGGTEVVYNPPSGGIYRVRVNVSAEKSAVVTREYKWLEDSDYTISFRRRGDPKAFGVCSESWQRTLWSCALSYVGSVAYVTSVVLPAQYTYPAFPIDDESPRCNIFVGHRIAEAGFPVLKTRGWLNRYPPLANDWGNLDMEIPNWVICDGYPEPGFVVSDPSSVGSGHVGIMDYDGYGISAGSENVNRKFECFLPNLVYRKYEENL